VEAARERGGRACGLGWGRRRGSSDGCEAAAAPLLWIGSRGWGRREGAVGRRGADSQGDAGEADSHAREKSTTKFLSPLHSF
jgi:hypothetical protein